MIAGISGKVVRKEPNFVDIHTAGGVIYRLTISLNTYGTIGNEATLLTTMIVREDALLLFGFADRGEQDLFEMLIKVNGVGPKSAMAILSTYTPEQFSEIITSQSETRLIKVPGIGKKTAALIILQLTGSIGVLQVANDSATTQAILALEALGFKNSDITKVLTKCKATETAALVKEALTYFQR